MRADEPTAWVVYRMCGIGMTVGRNAVCTQPEWDAMELARPGRHVLIRGQIDNEGVAERLARDLQTPPEPPKPTSRAYTALRRAERASAATLAPDTPLPSEVG
jgi:hypothetical protein